ncbi:unnamed protein product [Hydatigera taeniaeformis]|uniref:CN hydrolase domain-containing protein n=1 Tax=Hydatigena taeniaeformis TaxID=6205 RepID=A0A0R3X5A6_HYDTA|nr:unnamed protein product [Hydatigera taeniaeformis]
MPCLVLIRVRIQDLYTLRNAIYKARSVLEKGYRGLYIGISNDAERVPPCESQPLLNYGMGLFYFSDEADARRFIYSDQGFMETDFLENSDIMIIPMLKPLLIGCYGTALLFTELVRSENYCQMPASAITFDMEKCGAVPNIVDTIQVAMIRAYEAKPGGFRISQFPNKKVFYDWVKSGKFCHANIHVECFIDVMRVSDYFLPTFLHLITDCGARFREDMCKVRSMNTYIATFARDLF